MSDIETLRQWLLWMKIVNLVVSFFCEIERPILGSDKVSELADPIYKRLFKASPGKILVLRPHSFEIVSVTDAYLEATMTRENDIIGKTLFEVFPDNPDDPLAEGVRKLLASLQRVQSMKTTDIAGVVRYPVRRPDGSVEERDWSPVNSPVLNEVGDIEFIMHRVEDVTAIVQERDELDVPESGGERERHDSADGEIVVGYVQDITSLIRTRHKLTQAEDLLSLAGEKAQLGGWRVELDSEAIIWTPGTAAIHGMPIDYSPSTVVEAIQFYAPEYREVIKSAFVECAQQGEAFDIVCQLQLADGRCPWVRSIGVAERDPQGRINAVQGAFQDITTLHEAQVRADDAERQRLDVLESISDAVFALDTQWSFIYLNQQASVLLDRPSDQLLGKRIWDELPEAAGSQFQDEYQRAMQDRDTRRFQAFYSPVGKWFDVGAYPTYDGIVVYLRDVTAEREHQEQLLLVQASLARQSDIVIITTADVLDEPNGPIIVYVNDAFERLTGYTRSETIGKTPRMLQGPDSGRSELGRIRQGLEKKEPVRGEVLNYNKAGDAYWLEIDITPLFDESGHCTHFVAVERDITQRKLQEAELRQAQERFELISKATNDVIWDWSLETDKVQWNNSMTDVFGYILSELEPGSDSWAKRIHPDDLEAVFQSINKVIVGESEYWQSEYRFIRSNGDYAYVIDRGFITRDANRKATRMVGSMLDITEHRHLEERLRESQKLEAVGHLTGGVAHDFNNLLTVILGNSEMLVDDIKDGKLRAMAEMVVAAAQRAAELTSRLLAFARRRPLEPTSTDLNQLVESMQALIRRTLPGNIELVFALDVDLGITEIDAGELDAALLNLVLNAGDSMPGGGKLTIETTNALLDSAYAERHSEVVPGNYVMIGVSDNGTGMTPETVSRAVEPFFTTKPVGKGSGLGLSMVFGFTKQSGGHFMIYSELAEGTSVKLYFPVVPGAQQSNYQPAIKLEPQRGTEHILIAEDDKLVLQHLEGQLYSLGYRVTTAMSGPEALDALQAHADIDLLLTDIIMPGGMNGRELANKALGAYPSLKVLYTSGYTENAIVHHGRLDTGVELLKKPYTRVELAAKVRRVLDDILQ
jgi:PAS domain S-box-containing protein